MEFGRRQLTCAIGLLSTIFILGCSESSAYIEYSQLPKPTTGPVSADINVDVEPMRDDTDATESTSDAVDQPADTVDQLSAVEVDPTVNAVQAVYADTAPGTISQVGGEVTTDEPTVPRKIELLVPQKTFPSIKGTDAVRVSYDDIDLIKILNMDPVPVDAVDYFPEWLQQLDGQRIRIKGYMYPTFKSEGLKRFVLTRDTGECCFGPNAFVYFLVQVRLTEGQETDYIHNKPFDVEGIFRIDPEADDSGLFQLYRIEDAKML